MTFTICTNASEINAVDKELTVVATLTGVLKESTSITDPVITVSDITQYITAINYAYIPEFGRYYFVTDIRSVTNNLWEISMHVDVLYTYRDAIRANNAIIERNEAEYDLKLNDGLFKTQQNPRIATFNFPAGFNTWDFVLAVAGN